jgi:hypothetical protein
VSSGGRLAVSISILTGAFLIPAQLSVLATSLLNLQNEPTNVDGLECSSCGFNKHDNNANFCKVCSLNVP